MDTSTGTTLRTVAFAGGGAMFRAAFSSDGKLLAAVPDWRLTGREQADVHLWDTTTGTLLRRIPAAGVEAMSFGSPHRGNGKHRHDDPAVGFAETRRAATAVMTSS